VERIDVESALDMYEAVMARAAKSDIFIGAAAVSDYRVADPAGQKIKKAQETMTVTLERNPDILSTVASLKNRPFTVGFAAETHDLLEYAEDKRRRKRLDMIAANEVGHGRGFDNDHNALHVLWEGGDRLFPMADKVSLGRDLVALIAERYRAQH
jgi:phosphopantothenoylcysteine decarboxylase/phosphopantothenate--cysteine ligase